MTVKATLNSAGNPVDVNGDDALNEADFQAVASGALIEGAKRRGLLVHAWTFRNEPRLLASTYGGDPQKEYLQFFELGVDGVFSDFPDTAVTAREMYLKNQ